MLLILKWTLTDWWIPVKGKRRRFIYLKANNVIENVLVEDILKIIFWKLILRMNSLFLFKFLLIWFTKRFNFENVDIETARVMNAAIYMHQTIC